MLKKILLLLALMAGMCSPALAIPPISSFPQPAPGEQGPQVGISDGITDLNPYLYGDGTSVPPSSYPDVGAFRFICMAGQALADDPVVYPGKPGKSHIHQFYGNLGTNANSTYSTQRTTGLSTCQNILNRSGYWMPALLDGPGPDAKVIRPDAISIYYKRFGKDKPQCTPGDPRYEGICMGIPNGLRFITGYDMLNGATSFNGGDNLGGHGSGSTGGYHFNCLPSGPARATLVEAAADCTSESTQMNFAMHAPNCWDGRLDSPNHRDHLADRVINGYTGTALCPSTHPYVIPTFSLQAIYALDNKLNRSGTWTPGQQTWYLSCDTMFNMAPTPPGTCYHIDYFEGWNPVIKKMWEDNCIDLNLNCSGGTLGNGYFLNQIYPLTYIARPRKVNRPAMAREPFNGTVITAPR